MSINALKRISPLNLLVPFHHVVSNEPVPYIEPLYRFKNTRQFEADLDYLLRHFKPVSLADVIRSLKEQRPLSGKNFLITFDDALRQVYDVAMPILQRKGIPATLFVVPAFADNKALFYDLKKGLILHHLNHAHLSHGQQSALAGIIDQPHATLHALKDHVRGINYLNQQLTDQLGQVLEIDFDGFLKREKPFMTMDQLHDFKARGFHLGAHSMDHPLYRLVPLEEQIRQTEASIKWVTENFNLPYKAFAFTHTDSGISDRFFAHMFNRSPLAPDVMFGNTTGKLDPHPLVLHRYIGENPAIRAEKMAKAVLGFGAINKMRGKQYVERG